MDLTKGIIQDIATCAVAQCLESLGISSGHISQTRAEEVYGKWFKEAVRRRRLHPVIVGEGKNGKKLYSVSDIVALRAEDKANASRETKVLMANNN